MIINQLLMYLKSALTPQTTVTSFPMHILFLIFMGMVSIISAQAFFAYYVYLELDALEIFTNSCLALVTASVMLIEAGMFFIVTKCYVRKLATDNVVYHGYEKIKGITDAFLNGFNNR